MSVSSFAAKGIKSIAKDIARGNFTKSVGTSAKKAAEAIPISKDNKLSEAIRKSAARQGNSGVVNNLSNKGVSNSNIKKYVNKLESYKKKFQTWKDAGEKGNPPIPPSTPAPVKIKETKELNKKFQFPSSPMDNVADDAPGISLKQSLNPDDATELITSQHHKASQALVPVNNKPGPTTANKKDIRAARAAAVTAAGAGILGSLEEKTNDDELLYLNDKGEWVRIEDLEYDSDEDIFEKQTLALTKEQTEDKKTIKQTKQSVTKHIKKGNIYGAAKVIDDTSKQLEFLSAELTAPDKKEIDGQLKDIKTAREKALRQYKEDKDRIATAEIIETLGHALAKLGAATYGLKHNVDMSGLKFDKHDWSRNLNSASDSYNMASQLLDKDEKTVEQRRSELLGSSKTITNLQNQKLIQDSAADRKEKFAKSEGETQRSHDLKKLRMQLADRRAGRKASKEASEKKSTDKLNDKEKKNLIKTNAAKVTALNDAKDLFTQEEFGAFKNEDAFRIALTKKVGTNKANEIFGAGEVPGFLYGTNHDPEKSIEYINNKISEIEQPAEPEQQEETNTGLVYAESTESAKSGEILKTDQGDMRRKSTGNWNSADGWERI